MRVSFSYAFILVAFILVTGCGSNNSSTSSVFSNLATQSSSSTNEGTEVVAESENNNVATYLSMAVIALHEVNGFEAGEEFPPESKAFLAKHAHLFPATGDKVKEAQQLVDQNVQPKHINKNISKYRAAMIQDRGTVLSIEEEEIPEIGTISVLHVVNDEEDSYQIVYLGRLDVYEDDTVEFVGVPTLLSGFDNVSGGYTNSIIIVGSYVGKSAN
ncbi:hypothetical protein [Brevibacillus sp. DP1.3A]|uniref:hypothetical protein n=1 Tax=Brevibacillus sp. DP1.3A TaxID=2738867 RepID=UPI00156AB2C6|nr:hypothetical protein [Brevibacillus sp. DP1.3A]MED1919165.1 hypothetical protein [Bacillus thuringiensis]UED77660.1 hypothetical protein HP399_014770 [Brevibacillus sp. DP1.3A]